MLSLSQGTALYVGAVLGTGVIALPALAEDVAGPASLLAWGALVLASVPLAGTFAALAARHPDAGGVSTYARLAFGPRAAAVVGWCFYFAVPPGAAAAALFAGSYVAAATGFGAFPTGAALMLAVTAANAFGVRLSGRVQLWLAALLAGFLLVSVVLALPHGSLGNLHPFAPHGWLAIAPASALLVWSFAGWEAITHLAAEFRRPDRDLPRAAALAVAIVGGLYLAVAFATIVVLGGSGSDAPLGDLMATALGGDARGLAAIVALLLTFGVMNTYYAGAAKLGAALGRDGALPGWFARGSSAGEVPRRSLGLVAGLAAFGLAVVAATGIGAKPLVLATTGMFVLVYAVGVAAAVRLLTGRGRALAVLALAIVLLLALTTGPYLAWAGLVGLAALLYLKRRERSAGQSSPPPAAAPAATAAPLPQTCPDASARPRSGGPA
jgi:amino acid efflux transporter